MTKSEKKADELDFEVEIFQSNHEGAIIDKIQACYGSKDGIIINPEPIRITAMP